MANAAPATVTLDAELDIRAAAPLAAALLAARGKAVALDASQVERVGGQCLQVLLSAAATWARDGATLTLDDPSPAFVDVLAIAGVPLARLSSGTV